MRVVLTGASGQLGGYLRRRLEAAGHRVTAWSRHHSADGLQPVDLGDPEATARALVEADPEAILHAAAISSANQVWQDPRFARAVNVEATARLAGWCNEHGRRLIFTSTDLVFDGLKPWNREDDPARPTLLYGKTKVEAEPSVLAVPGGLVARLSLLYGPSQSHRPTYFDRTIAAWTRGESQTFFEDEYRTPLDLASGAEILVRLVETGITGLIHVGGPERLSRYELARRIAAALGFAPELVRINRQRDVTSLEPRPADVSLDSERLATVLTALPRPTVEEAVRALWAGSS